MRYFDILVFALNICLSATIHKYPRSKHLGAFSSVKNISHPIVRLGSYSFIAPFFILVFAPMNSGASYSATSTIYKYPHSIPLERLVVKNISHPAFRVGSHSFKNAMVHICINDEPSRSFGREDYLSPSSPSGESLIQCAISRTYIDAELSQSFSCGEY